MHHEPGNTPNAPGRFLKRYDRRKAARRDGALYRFTRAARVVVGVVCIIIAVAIGWLPGPGFVPLAVVGALLLAGEIRWVAVRLDPLERRIRRYFPLRRRIAWPLALLIVIAATLTVLAALQWRGDDQSPSPPAAARGLGVGLRPASGSYEFRGEGFERADVGAEINRKMPEHLTVIVKRTGGCHWSANYRYSSSRTLVEDMCSSDDGVLQLRTTATIKIGPLDEQQQIDCAPRLAYRMREKVRPGESWTFACTTTETDVAVHVSNVTSQGCRRASAAIAMTMKFDGKRSGLATYGYLLDERGLPIAFASQVSVKTKVGILPVTYESDERYRRVGTTSACSISHEGRVGTG